MIDWPVKALGDVATIATGKIDVNAATENGAYPFFTCSRDVYRIDDAPFEGKAILVAGNGDLNVKYYEGRFNAYQRTYFLFARDETKCDPRYLFWFLENHLDVLRSGASGSTIKYIRLGDLSEASIAVPPLEEQKRIVALLDAVTDRVNELTACYEQARTHANNLFTSALRDALESNSDWPVKTLGEMLELSYGKPLDAKDRDDNGSVPVYGANGVKAYSKKSLVAGPSIIVGRKGSAGELNFCEGPFWPLDVTYYVEHDTNETDLLFLHYLLSVMDLPSLAKGVKPGINRNDVYALQATEPPLDEQRRIVGRLDVMKAKTSEMISAYDVKLTAAKHLRQSVLEAAFTGAL